MPEVEVNTPEENQELPTGAQETLEPQLEGAAASDEPAPTEDGGIEIDGQVFKTEREAADYARNKLASTEQALLLEQARNQTTQDLLSRLPLGQQAPAAPAPEIDTAAWEAEYYANPKQTLDKMRAQIRDEVLGEVSTATSKQTEIERLWNKFTALHPHLADFSEDVRLMASEHKALIDAVAKGKGEDEALNVLARKVDEKFEAWTEKKKPRVTLTRTNTGMTPAGGKNVTPPTKEQKPIGFIQQMREHQKSRA